MESEAPSSAVSLAQEKPLTSSGSAIAGALAASLEETEPVPSASSPVSEPEEFLSDEEEPEPVPENKPAAAIEEENSTSDSNHEDAPSRVVVDKNPDTPPESSLSKDEATVADVDADRKASSTRAVESESLPSQQGLVNGGDRALDEDAVDGDEKKSIQEVEGGAKADSLEGVPDENSKLKVNRDGLSSKVNEGKNLLKGDEDDKDGGLHDNLVLDGAAAVKSEHTDTGDGDKEGTAPVAEAVQDLDAEKILSRIGVTTCGVEEEPTICEESKSTEKGRSVAQAEDLKREEDSAVTVQENGDDHDGDSDDNFERVTPTTADDQEFQVSDSQESPGHDCTETKEIIENVEKDEPPRVVDVSLGSRESEHSEQKPGNFDRDNDVDEIVPFQPIAGGDATEQTSAELQLKPKDAETVSANEWDAGYPENEQPLAASEEPLKSNVSGSEKACVFHISDSSEVTAHAEHAGLISGGEVNDKEEKEEEEEEEKDEEEEEEGKEGLPLDGPSKVSILGSSEIVRRIMKELDEGSSGPSSDFRSSQDYGNQMDGQIVSDSEEEVDTDGEGEGKELFDSAALTALLKAASGVSSDGTITISAEDAARSFSIERPAGLGSSIPSLKPAPARSIRANLFSPSDLAVPGEPENAMDEEDKKLQEKVDQIRVKFLRLVHRLGQSPDDRVASQVLYRLGLAEGIKRGRQIGRGFSLENAKKKALQLEEDGNEPLDFSCNILIIGKTGVGKSATINSIFGEEKVPTNAFESSTTSVKEIVGTVDGIKVCVTDTPGLRPSVMDQTANKRILESIKKYTKRCHPDIVLYVDRLDTQTWDFNDLPLLKSITTTLGSSIWFNAIVALTHAASAPPDGPSGTPLSYEVFIDQRSRIVQHAIRQAAGDMRLMNPVALVENHPLCRRNREGQRILPNGLSWRQQMLLLCYSSKILSEANSLLKLQEPSPGKLFGFRVRSPPLPFLLSSLLQSRAHPKLAADNGGDNGDSDIDLGDLSDSDQEEANEYDQLPPFKPLRKSQLAKLTKEQRKAYYDEYDYRVKLLQKKQWKEEIRRLKELKKMGKKGEDEAFGDMADDYDQDGAPAAVPVPLPDMVLPPSFDSDNPAYRFRFLELTSQLLARPVLDTHGWDHDCGYDGVSLEESLGIASCYPAAFSLQITKDKKEFNVHLDSSVSAKHGETGSTLAGFDIQSVGKQLAYILRSETKYRTFKKNKTAAGISLTFLGENVATGLKIEDQLLVGKRLGLVGTSGAVRAQGDVAYGANLEVRLRDKDFPISQDVSTLGLSLMRWRGDLALGANLQSQVSVGRGSKVAVRVGLNNKLSGQITVRTSTSDQLQIALLSLVPIATSVYRSFWSVESY